MTYPGEDKKAWIKAAVARRHETRSKQRARLGRERLKVIRRAIAKRGELWWAGALSQVLRPMLRGRHTGALVTITTADGRLHVRPGKVRKHLRRYFEAVFDNEGNMQWFKESEEDRRVLRDEPAG